MEDRERLRQRKKKKPEDEERTVPTAGSAGEPPVSPYRKVITRVITGAGIISTFSLILNSDHILIEAFIIVVQILVFREILNVRYNVVKEKQLFGFRSLNWFFLWTTLFFYYGKTAMLFLPFKNSNFIQNVSRYHMGISFSLYVIGFVLFILSLRPGLYRYQFGQMTWTLMILTVVVAQATFMIKNMFEGIIWFLLPCAIIVSNDIFAYFSGFFFGKKFIKRPFLAISPNKTWEGFIGATFGTIVFGFWFAQFLAQSPWFICPRAEVEAFKPLTCDPNPVFLPKNYYLPEEVSSFLLSKLGWDFSYITLLPIQLHSLVFSLFGSLIAPFGGFFASGIKRAYGKKDFDNIFPGHGGFTDRTDCQYIMGVFVYVYYTMFIRTATLGLDTIFDAATELTLAEQQILLARLNDTISRTLTARAEGL